MWNRRREKSKWGVRWSPPRNRWNCCLSVNRPKIIFLIQPIKKDKRPENKWGFRPSLKIKKKIVRRYIRMEAGGKWKTLMIRASVTFLARGLCWRKTLGSMLNKSSWTFRSNPFMNQSSKSGKGVWKKWEWRKRPMLRMLAPRKTKTTKMQANLGGSKAKSTLKNYQ